MRIGILGTGSVGKAIGSRLVEVGHQVCMGSRTARNEAAAEWAATVGAPARHGTFADAGAYGELLVNATMGLGSIDAIGAASPADLDGKVLLDISNPLDFSAGFPPTLAIKDSDSLAETIQRTFPGLRVVKALNTMTADVMVHPAQLGGPHDVLMSGNDADAKAAVATLLRGFGWPESDIVDLGDISTARGTEMYLPLWLRLMNALGTPAFNIKVVR
ncbi:MAG: NADPH-dependent F420 reductase [Actinomycetota bacterium]